VRDLNILYRGEPALHELDCEPAGFSWIDCNDNERSTLSWMRSSKDPGQAVLVACNFAPLPRHDHRIGVAQGGHWREILNSDAPIYGGSGQGNLGGVDADPVASDGHLQSLSITLPPLGIVVFKSGGR
jgi:1,4-alpha-glucan branching enzyme